MSLGVSDPVTKKTFASNAVYFEKLANELTEVLYEPISVVVSIWSLFSNLFCF